MANSLCNIISWFALAFLLAGVGCTMDMSSITPEARTAIETKFPKADVREVQARLGGLYEIELLQDKESLEVKLHQDGTIIEIETIIDASDLPEPVMNTVTEKTKGKELKEVEKVQLLARQTLGGLQKLEKPEVFYEIEWLEFGFEQEINVNPDGSIR
ncbi:MAG: PepSY-like domain-containing protein [Planctomycetota bacterium]|nr:MAG: PepSY-like domain-containing protein [Planctomycetota bacterium]